MRSHNSHKYGVGEFGFKIIRKFTGFIRLIRPELPFAAGVSVLMGEIITLGGLPSTRQALLGFICGFTLSASALILNNRLS